MKENDGYRPISGLSIIAESINDSVPSTHELFEKDDVDGICSLAKAQADGGGRYIDVNVGRREPIYIKKIVEKAQSVMDKPLSIDSPDFELQKAGLSAYDLAKAKGVKPIVNSISELRMEIFELYSIQPFMPILMCSERDEQGKREPNKTGHDIHETAKRLVAAGRGKAIANNEIIIDVGLAPIAADYENILKTSLEGMKLIHDDPDLTGVHFSVGLSNFSVMLPPRTQSGLPMRTALESGFITLAKPLGLDFVIGNVKKKYAILDDANPVLVALKEAMAAGGYGSIERIQQLIAS